MNVHRKALIAIVASLLFICSILIFSPQAVAVNKGYYYTSGSKILDSHGKEVNWNGLNWFGFETANFAPHGLWTRNMEEMLDQAKEQGYNLIRLPYSNQMFDDSSQINGIDFQQNPKLKGLKPIEVMDYVIEQAGQRGFKVILDRHRPDANGQSELWYTSAYPEKRWITDWTMLAQRYKGNEIVIGADLHNEPHGAATWGSNDKNTDWRLAAQRAGNAILKVNSDWLIIVEGISSNVKDAPGSYWWGGNLLGVANYPVRLQVSNRIVYSAHDYGPGVSHQEWFDAANFPSNMPAIWDKYWGYISKQEIAPVLVGEFGGRSVDTNSVEGKWQHALVQYIKENQLYWTYWSLNPNSGDTGGLLQDDWKTWNKEKQEMLTPIMKGALTVVTSSNSPTKPTSGSSKIVSCRYDQAPAKLRDASNLHKAALQAANQAKAENEKRESSVIAQDKQIHIMVQNEEAASSNNSIKLGIQLKNTSEDIMSLSDLTIRYWYTLDSDIEVNQQFHVDYTALGQDIVTGRFVALDKTYQQADYYVEIGFTKQAGSLSQDQSTGEIKLRWNKEDWSDYMMSNDYSFVKSNQYVLWNRMTVYMKGKLLAGVEPPVEER